MLAHVNVCLLFVRVQLYREKSVIVISSLASHIDTTVIADRTYQLIPESEEGDPEAQVNATILTEAPDQSPEEPKANLASDYREGKPRT